MHLASRWELRAWSGWGGGARGGVLLVGVGAPGGVVQRGEAGAPNEWRLQCERPRAEVCGCAVR
jgi:hypothetical protein